MTVELEDEAFVISEHNLIIDNTMFNDACLAFDITLSLNIIVIVNANL